LLQITFGLPPAAVAVAQPPGGRGARAGPGGHPVPVVLGGRVVVGVDQPGQGPARELLAGPAQHPLRRRALPDDLALRADDEQDVGGVLGQRPEPGPVPAALEPLGVGGDPEQQPVDAGHHAQAEHPGPGRDQRRHGLPEQGLEHQDGRGQQRRDGEHREAATAEPDRRVGRLVPPARAVRPTPGLLAHAS
jgi:hypothetical protein